MAKSGSNTSELNVEVRATTGKGASRRARREGKVPAVLYGHGTDPQHLEFNARDFAAILRHSGTNAVLSLKMDGGAKEQLALPKVITIHPIRRTITHADLIVVKRGEKVTVEVTITVEGDAASGTLVTQDANTVEIEAEALSIPDGLVVSVEGVEEGTQILASEIELPAGVTLVSDPDMLVVNVVAAPTAEDLDGDTAGDDAEGGEESEAAGDGDGEAKSDEAAAE